MRSKDERREGSRECEIMWRKGRDGGGEGGRT